MLCDKMEWTHFAVGLPYWPIRIQMRTSIRIPPNQSHLLETEVEKDEPELKKNSC